MRRLIHLTALAVVVGVVLGLGSGLILEAFGSTTFGPIAVVAFAFLVGWAGSGYYLHVICRRRVTPEEAGEQAIRVAMNAIAMALAGECVAAAANRNGHVCICVRPYEHTGPHECGVCGEISR